MPEHPGGHPEPGRGKKRAVGYAPCTREPPIRTRLVRGTKNAAVSVAGQTVLVYGNVPNPLFYATCPSGYYGQTDEVCLPCPRGALCAGGAQDIASEDGTTCKDCPVRYVEPVARAQWWHDPVSTKSAEAETRCQAERIKTREVCPSFVPCEPREACLASNTCAEGYQGYQIMCEKRRDPTSATFIGGDNSCTTDLDCNPTGNPQACNSAWIDIDICSCVVSLQDAHMRNRLPAIFEFM